MGDFSIKAVSQSWIKVINGVDLAVSRFSIPVKKYDQQVGEVLLVSCRDREFSEHQYMPMLDLNEQQSINCIQNKDSRQKVLAGKVLRRIALTMATNGCVAEQDWKFGSSKNDKPIILKPLPNFSFNITHSAGTTFVAVSNQYQLGVDAEAIIGTFEEEFLQDVLSKDEYRTLRNMRKTEKTERFLKFWTLKEAYLKLLGTGLADDLKQIAFELCPIRVKAWNQDSDAHFLTWKTTNGSNSFRLSIALI